MQDLSPIGLPCSRPSIIFRYPKQRELGRILEILHEEFEDALTDGTADFKKRGRILKIVLFGSYAQGRLGG
ncbi:putative nucleotidyltransferase [Rhizobium favelukesii]|uniref:Nucleotidyltransferase n=1 Tax=Rhizobium favelukesii TaxID=348824 RepID=W6R6C7_9HYPH|nr:putative nucleotidyltransferase [Rhizobium favelukesii]